MSMSMKCGECQNRFKFQEKHAGKTVKCPGCGTPVLIPPIDLPPETKQPATETHYEEDWSWSDAEEENSWNGLAGDEGGFADEQESRPLPPRSGQKRKSSTGSGTTKTSESSEQQQRMPAGFKKAAVFFGGAVISLVLTLVTGLLTSGGAQATGTVADATRVEVTEVPPVPQPTEDTQVASRTPEPAPAESQSEAVKIVEPGKNPVASLQSPLLTFPVNIYRPGMIGDTGILTAFSGDKIVGFKPSFFDGDENSIIGPVELPGSKVVERLSRRFEGRTVFLVTDLSGRIHELNPETFEILRSATLFEWPPRNAEQRTDSSRPQNPPYVQLISSYEDTDPYVYASVYGGSTSDGPTMWAIDLKTFEVIDHPAVAKRMLGYEDTRFGNAPLACQVLGPHPAWIDPHERFLVRTNSVFDLIKEPLSVQVIQQLMSEDSSIRIERPPVSVPLDVHPLCVIDDGRWIVGLTAEKSPQRTEGTEMRANPVSLCLLSPESFETVTKLVLPNAVEVPMPTAAQQATGRTDPNAGQTTWQTSDGSLRDVMAFDDPIRKRLILNSRKTAVAIPYDLTGVSQRPILALRNRRTECLVGEQVSFDLQPVEEQTKMAIIDAPKGMTINGTRLEWIPTQNDVGNHAVRLQMKKSGFERSLIANVTVNNRGMPWRGSSRGIMTVSSDGNIAMAVMEPEVLSNAGYCTVFDLKERRLIAEKNVPGRLYSINVGSKYFVALREILVSGRYEKEIVVGSVETLEVLHAIPNNFPGVQLVNDRYVYPRNDANNPNYDYGAGWLDLEEKNPQWQTPTRNANIETQFVSQRGFQSALGSLHAGIYRDAKDNQPSLLAGISDVFSVGGFRPVLDRGSGNFSMNAAMPYTSGMSQNHRIGNALFSQNLLASNVCHRAQVRLEIVQYEPDPDRRKVEDTFYLVAVSLKTNEVVGRWMVLRQAASAYRHSTGSALAVHGDTAWVLIGGKLQEISLADLPDQSPNLQIDLTKVPMRLDTGKTSNEFTYNVRGDREPLETRLVFMDCGSAMFQNFVTPGEKLGEFKVDGTAVLGSILGRRGSGIPQNFVNYGVNEVPWIPTYKDRAATYLKSALDYAPKDVPFTTTLQFSVTDADGNTEELIHQVVFEVPAEDLETLIQSNISEYNDLHKK